jgi:hypothetical protein
VVPPVVKTASFQWTLVFVAMNRLIWTLFLSNDTMTASISLSFGSTATQSFTDLNQSLTAPHQWYTQNPFSFEDIFRIKGYFWIDIHIAISFFLTSCKKKIALERLLLDRPRMSRYILDGLYNFVLFLLIIIKG